jgi:GST-like protein
MTASPDLDLYFFPTPNGLKISIMLEECGLPYRLVPVNIGKGDQLQPDYLKINPNNKIPSLIDRAAPGGPLTLFESGAILLYLAEKSGRFCPTDLHGRYEVLKWLMWQMSSIGPIAGQSFFFRGLAEPIPLASDRFAKEMGRLFTVMERALADRDYLAGDYSVADIATFTWVRAYDERFQVLHDYPKVRDWSKRIAARPAVRRGLEVGSDLRGK